MRLVALLMFATACGQSTAVSSSCLVDPPSTQVGVTHATIKIRDDSALPATRTISIEAARNEVEPFQIVVNGATTGVDDLVVSRATFVRDDNSAVTLAPSNIRLYQEGRYNVRWASSAEGGAGYWPDPLIPDVDAYDGQPRNAFVNFDVAPNQSRAVWIDVRVPDNQPAGLYTARFQVSAANLVATTVTVHLRVRDFALPSTSSLKSAFNINADQVTRAHLGGQWCSDFAETTVNTLLTKYGRAALDDRISLMSPICGNPVSNLGVFDQYQGALLGGTAQTELAGARTQSFRNPTDAAPGMSMLAQHFASKQYAGLFDYSCDEPPSFCDESTWPARAQAAHDAGIPNLVTTTYDYAIQKGWTDLIDILVPVAETMNDASRAHDAEFLALSPAKRLWWYQSCDSHGCGGCDAGMASWSQYQGLPLYTIDSDARQNRSMEWLSYIFDVDGELYFETAMDLQAGLDWDSGIAYCGFGGSGDGTLFYPGKPGDPRIGGTTDIPLESIRMKLIREGMEDFEYLRLYEQKFGRDATVAKARLVFPDVFGGKAHPAEYLYEIRHQLADAIEGTPAPSPIDVPYVASIDLAGDLHEFAASPSIPVAAGAADALFHLAWTEEGLYVAATVSDADIRAIGMGEDGQLYNADSIEIMLDALLARTDTATSDQLQVIISANGDKYDARGAGATGDASFDLVGLDWHAMRESGGYRIAAKLPWSSLTLPSGANVGEGLELGIDLALDNLDAGGLAYADWAAITPFAQPSRWHSVRLVGGPACP
jgi:hypothetical protein